MADDLAIAGVKGDLTAFNCCHHANAAILILEYPDIVINGPSVSVASIGCRRLGNVEVRATITRSMGGRCNGQGKQPVAGISRCCRACVLFELDGAIQQYSRALRAAAASRDAEACAARA
jgi:hypothetical protein